MTVSPRRRRRILRVHQLRQNGRSLKYIAEKLNVSIATVHADLRLLETNWNDIALATRNDLLLQQITRVNGRIIGLINGPPPGEELCATLDEFLRVQALHTQNLNAACRELRLLLRELPCEAPVGNGQIIELERADYPDHELADPEPDQKKLKEPEKAETPQPAIPSNTQEIVASAVPEKYSLETLNPNLPRNTGRNRPCPCGSGSKRKHCHPQHAQSSAPPAGIEAQALRLTERYQAAEQCNDPLAQVNALEQLVDLYGP